VYERRWQMQVCVQEMVQEMLYFPLSAAITAGVAARRLTYASCCIDDRTPSPRC